MNEQTPHSHAADAAAPTDGADARRALFLLRAGARLFAVDAEEIESTAENLTPAPLPFAPPAVLGVVSLRGRMRTALDPLRLAPEEAAYPATNDNEDARAADDPDRHAQSPPRLFVALRGDEQLALACDSVAGTVEVAPSELVPPPPDAPAALATFRHGDVNVTLLDASRLFEAAMRGTDRRRRRS